MLCWSPQHNTIKDTGRPFIRVCKCLDGETKVPEFVLLPAARTGREKGQKSQLSVERGTLTSSVFSLKLIKQTYLATPAIHKYFCIQAKTESNKYHDKF